MADTYAQLVYENIEQDAADKLMDELSSFSNLNASISTLEYITATKRLTVSAGGKDALDFISKLASKNLDSTKITPTEVKEVDKEILGCRSPEDRAVELLNDSIIDSVPMPPIRVRP